VAISPADHALLQRCLKGESQAWHEFVDRYLGLVYHVVHHSCHQRGVRLNPEDIEDLAAEVLLQFVNKKFAVLRAFQGRSSLATYITVVARRCCMRSLSRRQNHVPPRPVDLRKAEAAAPVTPTEVASLETVEQVHNLLTTLPNKVREVVRMHYLEGRSYEEISTVLGIPVNTIGPLLSRAKQALRQKIPSSREDKQKE
jgi:RNA polymerase sigma-70 factor (ECF subfamily)